MSLAIPELTPDVLQRLSPAALDAIRKTLGDAQKEERDAYDWLKHARPNQLPPPGDWQTWVIRAGRGFGKTRAGAEWVRSQIESGRCKRMHLVAPTASDVRDTMVEGVSGLLAVCPPWNRPVYEPTKRRLTWPNGSVAILFSAEEPDRLRGPSCDGAWCDELAAWTRPETFDQLQFGLRLGKNPQCCVTTTPRPTRIVKDLLANETTVETHGSTYENRANLAPAFFNRIITQYDGTRLGRQEILAEVLEDNPAALWTRDNIDSLRVSRYPELIRIVVAVDPSGSSGEGAAEAGIVVAGVGIDGHGYVLSDRTLRGTPEQWGRVAVNEYHRWKADRVVAEINYGGEMVRLVIQTADPTVPFKQVTASRGKQVRAEPISGLYEQCVAEGTLVSAEYGARPIQDIRAGDRVWTRKGLRTVIWAGQTGIRETLLLKAGDNFLVCTPDHPVYTVGRGFIRAGTIAPKRDIILACNQSPVALTVTRQLPNLEAAAVPAPRNVAGRQLVHRSGLLSSLMGAATIRTKAGIGGLVATQETDFSTATSGSRRTGRSPMGATSIISTAIPSTTGSRTSSQSATENTARNTRSNRPPPRFEPGCPRRNFSGGGNESLESVSAISAAEPLRRPPHGFDSALLPATRAIGIGSVESGRSVPVYNLHVEDEPEFFAGGILVHNCRVHHVGSFPTLEDQMCDWMPGEPSPDRMDALVWAITELMLGPTGPWEFF